MANLILSLLFLFPSWFCLVLLLLLRTLLLSSSIYTFLILYTSHFLPIVFITFSTILLCYSSFSISAIILLIKLAIFLILIKSYRILFIIVWNIAGELVSSKNIIINIKIEDNRHYLFIFIFIFSFLFIFYSEI